MSSSDNPVPAVLDMDLDGLELFSVHLRVGEATPGSQVEPPLTFGSLTFGSTSAIQPFTFGSTSATPPITSGSTSATPPLTSGSTSAKPPLPFGSTSAIQPFTFGSFTSNAAASQAPFESLQSSSPSPIGGTLNDKVVVSTNFFRLNVNPETSQIIKYEVTFSPMVYSASQRRLLMNSAISKNECLKCVKFDGFNAFAPCNLSVETFIINRGGGGSWHVTLKKLDEDISNEALSTIFNRSSEGLPDVMCEYQRSVVKTSEGRFIRIVPVINKRSEDMLPVSTYVEKLLGISLDNMTSQLSRDQLTKAENMLRDVKVKVDYPGHTAKWKVRSLTLHPINTLRFDYCSMSNGEEKSESMTVFEYFKSKDRPLKFPFLPAIDAVPSGKQNKGQAKGYKSLTYLPLEICMMKKVKGSDIQNAKVLENTPINIVNLIKKGNKYNVPTDYGLNVEKELMQVEARVLPAPELMYKKSEVIPENGCWNFSGEVNKVPTCGKEWGLISFCPQIKAKGSPDMLNFRRRLIQCCETMGMKFKPSPGLIRDYEPANCDSFSNLTNGSNKYAFLLIILPPRKSRPEGLYEKVKSICETVSGFTSQCLLSHTVSYPKPEMLTNICMQICTKLGGSNLRLKRTCLDTADVGLHVDTMIMGADVTHPTPESRLQASIVAVVGSLSWPSITPFKVVFSSQEAGQEYIDDFEKLTEELLHSFKEKNGYLPKKIIIYRDGVGDEQFEEVMKKEMMPVYLAYSSVGNGSESPKITYLVGQKRNSMRLFCCEESVTNVSAGTVIDTECCRPGWPVNFYMISHATDDLGRLCKPVHYNILQDDSNFSTNEIEKLTNDLCYTYPTCTKAISLAAPLLHAHKGASRARIYAEYVGKLPEVHENVKDSMFYI